MYFTFQYRIAVFLVLIVVFSLNITFWLQDTGSRHCATVGRWRDFQWHSDLTECSLHNFTSTDVQACLHERRVVFIGDGKMKELFLFFVSFLTAKPHLAKANLHLSVKIDSVDVTMDYYQHDVVDEGVDNLYQEWKLKSRPPQLILHNGCSWILNRKHTMSRVLAHTTGNISRLIGSQKQFISVNPSSEIYWLPQDNLLIDKLWGRARKSINKHIQACDEAIRHAYLGSAVHYMEPLVTLTTGIPHKTINTASIQNLTLKAKLDVVLSSYCSLLSPDPKLSPRCCVGSQPSQWLLVAMVLSVAIYLGSNMIVATNTLQGLLPFIQASKQVGLIPVSNQRLSIIGQIANSLCYFIMILLLIYVFDRTFLFIKTDKIASLPIFLLLLLSSMLGGVFTLTESEEYGFFDDQQVDELKGVAMLFILCYSYMAPAIQQATFPHTIHQLSIGLYLFTDAYGQFVSFRHNKRFRISQLMKCLVHINLFPFLLGLLLKTPYSVYYLASILSFSCVFMYIVIFTHPRITDFSYTNSVIVIKFALIAVILWFLPPINSLIRPKRQGWQVVFALIDNNKFVPLLGLLVGYVVTKTKEAEWSVHTLSAKTQMMLKTFILLGSLLALIFMIAISRINFSFTIYFAIVLLRNFHSSLQKYNSCFLQIAGILSYELFLVHFHVWTAYHGGALLLMTPEIELVNFLLASLVLASVSDYLNSATESLLNIYCS